MRLFKCWMAAGLLAATGCSVGYYAVLPFFYAKAKLPKDQVRLNIPYEADDAPKHRLDLFLPKGTNWPVMVFIYGGGWTMGDKSLEVGGDDVYGNIGRFYAAHGIGVAVINYRLLPKVEWRAQISDCAHAVAWVYTNISSYGGDPQRLFLCGHSAGGQLVDRLALDKDALGKVGLSPAILSGVISVSGAGLDMTDLKTYELGESPDYYAKLFEDGSDAANWPIIASPLSYLKAGAPPFLILYAGGETKSLIRQSHLLSQKLTQAGVKNKLVEVPGQSHARMVLTLSRDDKTSGPAVLDFIRHASRN